MTTITFDEEAIFALPSDAYKIYMWMKVYLPGRGHEISYRELAINLFMSPTTVRKYMDWMVDNGWVERTVSVGLTATYRIIQ